MAIFCCQHMNMTGKESNDNQFDIVVVGCGPSAIGLLYGILTRPELSSLTVAVVDVGGESERPHNNEGKATNGNESVRDWFRNAHASSLWKREKEKRTITYPTVPQRHLHSRVLDVPIGIGQGGGTRVNACFCDGPVYCEDDFKDWPEPWTDGSLVKDAVESLQQIMKRNGGSTVWNACPEYSRLFHLLSSEDDPKDDAANKLHNLPPGSTSSFVHSFLMSTNSRFERINYFDSILGPLLIENKKARGRITWISHACVNRIIIDNGRACGVECENSNGDKRLVYARKEVVLCAGAIMSPAVLLMSGIGEESQLQQSGISPCHAHLPRVGKNLRDHLLIPRAFFSPSNQFSVKKSANCCQAKYNVRIDSPRQEAEESDGTTSNQENGKGDSQKFQFLLTDGAISLDVIPLFLAYFLRRGKMSTPQHALWFKFGVFLFNGFCFVMFRCLKICFSVIFSYIPPFRIMIQHFTTTINICIMSPKSHGSVRIQSSQQASFQSPKMLHNMKILVDPGYLSDTNDMASIRAAWQISDSIRQKHFAGCMEVLPGPQYKWGWNALGWAKTVDDKPCKLQWLDAFVRDFALPYYHWCGTCSMGNTADSSVVDAALRVYRVIGLRVCDASVFPSCISSPTSMTCAAIGYIASSFLVQ
jgi:choline dehydrogenase